MGDGRPPGGWARCNLDGRPLSPGDRRAMADFAQTLQARQADPSVHWAELVDGELPGTFWRYWHCAPPVRPGQDQRELRGQWDQSAPDGIPIWRIDEIKVRPDAAAQDTAGRADRPGPARPGTPPGPAG